jgi:hypothetical protein
MLLPGLAALIEKRKEKIRWENERERERKRDISKSVNSK